MNDTDQNISEQQSNIESTIKEIRKDLETNYLYPKSPKELGHFQNGYFLHSKQYYFAKSYFHSSQNCEKLADVLIEKLKNLKIQNATIIGFRIYTSLLLNIVKSRLRETDYAIDYAIVDQIDAEKFTWELIPDFNTINREFIVLLPITCTCSTYIRIKKFLSTYIIEQNLILKNKLESLKEKIKAAENNKIALKRRLKQAKADLRKRTSFNTPRQHELGGLIHELTTKLNDIDEVINFFKNDSSKNERYFRVRHTFLNVFIILDRSVEKLALPIALNNQNEKIDNFATKVSTLYSDFGWTAIKESCIEFTSIDEGANSSQQYLAFPLVKLYADLSSPEDCKLCFPVNNLAEEKSIFRTHGNFETPQQLLRLPRFGKNLDNSNAQEVNEKEPIERRLFSEIFSAHSTAGPSHLYPRVLIGSNTYLHYIRGNAFFKQNNEEILIFFNLVLKEALDKLGNDAKNASSTVLFITPESKHNSTFLEELVTFADSVFTDKKSKNRPTAAILHVNTNTEFVDNFLSNYFYQIQKADLVIFFEDVLSAGRTFKQLSDYIKHYKARKITSKKSIQNVNHGRGIDEDDFLSLPGFDFVFTLVDRTPYFTKQDIIKKLYSKTNLLPHHSYKAYYSLDVPVVEAANLGNPFDDAVTKLNSMRRQAQMSILVTRIRKEIKEAEPAELPEDNPSLIKPKQLKYFPFESADGLIDTEVLSERYEVLHNGKLDLLKLYVTHNINSILADEKFQGTVSAFSGTHSLVEVIAEDISSRLKNTEENFFRNKHYHTTNTLDNNLLKIENKIIIDTVVKVLSRHPFTYYQIVYDSVFSYCLKALDNIIASMDKENRILNFEEIRDIKFYVKQLTNLDSACLISVKFLEIVKLIFEKKKDIIPVSQLLQNIYTSFKSVTDREPPVNEIEKLRWEFQKMNLRYKYDQTASFSSFLIFAFKELIYKNASRAIKLEALINSERLLPIAISNPTYREKEPIELIQDAYYQITGMIKAENIFVLQTLKEKHKVQHELRLKQNSQKKPPIQSPSDIKQYYFDSFKSDPDILNLRKFVNQSRYSIKGGGDLENIKLSVAHMLQCAIDLTHSNNTESYPFSRHLQSSLRSIVDILQPGIKDKLGFILSVRYKETDNIKNLSDSIYTITSNQEDDSNQISEEGLSFMLLNGLYLDSKKNGEKAAPEQSILVTIKQNEKVYSFRDSYRQDAEKYEIQQMFLNDCKRFPNDGSSGLLTLGKAAMCIYIRLPEIRNSLEAMGKAVLVITTEMEVNTKNFLEFVSNEKIRLILLIKDEITTYLKKKFDSHAFEDLIQQNRENTLIRKREHMVPKYCEGMREILARETLTTLDKKILSYLTKRINTHIDSKQDVPKYKEKNYPTYRNANILEIFEILMLAPSLALYTIQAPEQGLKIEFDKITCHPIVFDQIIPEIIINMRRAACMFPQIDKGFEIIAKNNVVYFSNKYETVLGFDPTQVSKLNGGKDMCNSILEIIGLTKLEFFSKELDDVFSIFTVKLNLNKKKDEKETFGSR